MSIVLSPLGAVRRALAGDDRDRFFRTLGVGAARCDLGDQGLYLAEELVQWNPWMTEPERRAFGVFVLALLLATRSGSTRLELDPRGPGAELIRQVLAAAGLAGELEPRRILKEVTRMAGGLERVIGPPSSGPEARPLIADHGCVYPHRLWWLEGRLAAQLAARLGQRVTGLDPAAVTGAVDEVAGSAGLTDEQAAAVAAAAGYRLAVITGGPGTGKTATLAAIVRVLTRLGVAPDRIGLAAPTGKAAYRMTEAVAAAVRGLDGVDAALAAAPPRAATVHRLLGYQPGGGFRHGEGNPVAAAAVIVDEASMIDLVLMERLGRALAPETRLVLIGDPHQLPSVEAGSVLADLLAAAGEAPWAARLTHSFRADAGTRGGAAILAAARAVFTGEAARLVSGRERLAALRARADAVTDDRVEALDSRAVPVTGFVDVWWRRRREALAGGGSEGERDLARRVYRREAGSWEVGDAAELERLLGVHEQSRLLTVTRAGETGALTLAARCHAHMLAESTAEGSPDFLPGEPVLFTRNDYDRGLFNGDQGVIARVVDDGGHHYRAVFRRAGELVPFPIDALRGGLELAWAMTVHKSQGSELDQVALIIPAEDTPLITRELIYTALTRARTSAIVVGPLDLVARAGARAAVRSSGLAARLRTLTAT